jgi:hypothetical protein
MDRPYRGYQDPAAGASDAKLKFSAATGTEVDERAGEIPANLLLRELRSPDEIIADTLRDGQLAVLGGHYGVGKSPLLQQLSVCTVSGAPFLGRKVFARPVILIDFKTPAAIFQRNVPAIRQRLRVALPEVPDALEPYLEHDDAAAPGTRELFAALRGGSADRLRFLRSVLRG